MGRTGWIVLFSAVLFVFVVGSWFIYMNWMESRFGEMEQRGLFGDQFGGINALFTGLAFAGLIITIILQSQELRLQRQELRETREEFIQQNETLKLQRFENTFFNLLDVHNKIVDNLKYRYPESGVFGGTATTEGRSAFRMMYRSLQKKTMLNANPNDMRKEDFEKLTRTYKVAITENNDLSNITYYFQSLATVLEFIATSDLLSVKRDSRKEEKNRRTYFKIFTSTQSEKEKSVVFYHIAFGWTVSAVGDYLTTLRVIEKQYTLYNDCATIFLPQKDNYHMFLLKRFFEIFPVQ